MAVVQISKIQVRRGKKSQTNIPQLAGGEFGWAVDSQQLYIGNGSVGEGAPFVGNTEILTERSNIFDLLGAYTYKGNLLDNNGNSIVQTGIDSSNPLTRSLQNKLDDIVNVKDFGAVGDLQNGIGTDDTVAIQRAIDQLYINPASKTSARSKKILYFPAGEYRISNPLRIPSNVTLIGEGIDKTIIVQTDINVSIVKTISDDSSPGVYLENMDDNNAPSNVFIEGFTFKRQIVGLEPITSFYLNCLRDSKFKNCKFQGVWQNGTGIDQIRGNNSAIQLVGLGAVSCSNIEFIGCEFKNFVHAIYSDFDSYSITVRNSKFNFLYRAVTLSETSTSTPGQTLGPQNYTLINCEFDKIDAEAWKVFKNSNTGGHKSISNRYYDVGNNSLGQSQPTTPILDFNAINCDSDGDFFQRHFDINEIDINKTGLSSSLIAYVPDVLGVNAVKYGAKTVNLLFNTPVSSPKILMKSPVWQQAKIIIDYVIKKSSSEVYRSGQLVISVHPNMANISGPNPTFVDTFTYTSQTGDLIGPSIGGNIQFFANVVNLTSVDYVKVNNQITPINVLRPTLLIRYSNPTGPGTNAFITYTTTIVSSYKEI
jgi:hypothetical protein